jgi:hypothetical protein
MRRIGQPAVGKCVRHQQVAEFVVNAGDRNVQPRQGEQANSDYG